jgi:hypothetical protein
MTVERREEIRDVLDAVASKVNEDGATDILVLVKTDSVYSRYSTSIDNAMEIVAQLEILKYDILRRMHS